MDGLLPLAGVTGSDFFTDPAIRILVVGHTVMMAMALPLAVLAVKEYRGAPWGKVLEPLPVVAVALLVSSSLHLVVDDAQLTGYLGAIFWGVAALGIALSVMQTFLLLTGRRRI